MPLKFTRSGLSKGVGMFDEKFFGRCPDCGEVSQMIKVGHNPNITCDITGDKGTSFGDIFLCPICESLVYLRDILEED